MQSWLNGACDKYNHETNPAWSLLPTDGIYATPTRDMITVWHYISGGQLPVTGETNPATINHTPDGLITVIRWL